MLHRKDSNHWNVSLGKISPSGIGFLTHFLAHILGSPAVHLRDSWMLCYSHSKPCSQVIAAYQNWSWEDHLAATSSEGQLVVTSNKISCSHHQQKFIWTRSAKGQLAAPSTVDWLWVKWWHQLKISWWHLQLWISFLLTVNCRSAGSNIGWRSFRWYHQLKVG